MTDWDKMIAPPLPMSIGIDAQRIENFKRTDTANEDEPLLPKYEWNLTNNSKIIFAGIKEPIKSLEIVDLIWHELAAPERNPLYSPINNMIGNKNEERVYSNNMPTHDPYSNPDALIYYQCNCGAILDPLTKSFASLNNHASNAGWKIRWNKDGSGYQPFCVECGEDVE